MSWQSQVQAPLAALSSLRDQALLDAQPRASAKKASTSRTTDGPVLSVWPPISMRLILVTQTSLKGRVSMPELILHHYAISPFAEKARVMLGYKQLVWRSVDIPVVMPKPDLTALTGGYRKTPVLQVGCDIYCDTALIARVLDALYPERPLFHPGQDGVAIPAGRWFDRELFFAAIAQIFHPSVAAANAALLGGPEQMAAFAADRGPMMSQGTAKPTRSEDGRLLVAQTLAQLEAQLAAGGPYLFGATFGWSDLCAYHPLWALRRNPALGSQLDDHPRVLSWLERIAAHGHGRPSPLDASEALTIARRSRPAARSASVEQQLERIKLGDRVEVAAIDYGIEPSVGQLVYIGPDELAIEREDERAGRLVVHFPRVGFRIKAC